VRYEPLPAASSEGLPLGIYVTATDVKSGQRLWATRVWETVIDPDRETDVQNFFIRALTLDAVAGLLRVEDEKGRTAQVDIKGGKLHTTK